MVSLVLFITVLMYALLLGFVKLSITLRSLFDTLEIGILVLKKGQNQGNGSVFEVSFFF